MESADGDDRQWWGVCALGKEDGKAGGEDQDKG